jgi:hypothetical protein
MLVETAIGTFAKWRPTRKQLGAKTFEAVSLHDLAMVARAEASSAEAMDLLYRALGDGDRAQPCGPVDPPLS